MQNSIPLQDPEPLQNIYSIEFLIKGQTKWCRSPKIFTESAKAILMVDNAREVSLNIVQYRVVRLAITGSTRIVLNS